MTPARLRTVVAIAVLVGAVAWAVLDARDSAGAPPVPVPWTAAVAVALLAVAVLVSAREVRRWVAGARRMDALSAARIAVLAKAAAYTGAALAGWYLAQAVVVLPDVVGDRLTRLLLALVSALASVGLVAAGLVGQRWCRRPPDDDETGSAAADRD